MPDNSKFRSLSVREQAVVAVGVLLDGFEAIEFLRSDKERGNVLARSAKDIIEFSPDLRMPLLGTLLRDAVDELERELTEDR